MFNQSHFIAGHWDADHWIGAPDIGASTTVSTTWIFEGSAYASQSLDYIVKASDNTILASGTAATNTSGVLTIAIDASYSGQKVLVHVENVGSDMTTSGKRHGTQVVTAA